MPRVSPSTDPASPPRQEEGSAALEFLTAGLILLLPLVYLVVAMSMVQTQALGVEAAARQGAGVVARSGSSADVAERLPQVIAAVATEYDIDPARLEVRIDCLPQSGACPQAGATVRVSVRGATALPLVPDIFGWRDAVSVPVEGVAVQKVSRFWDDR